MGRHKKYFTEEEKKAAKREADRRWEEKNSEKAKTIHRIASKRWKEEHPEYMAKYDAERYKTPKGRAIGLLKAYRQTDIRYNRGECTLTADWIVENIFSGQCCAHCGETDWRKLGCNRLDNSLPHTPDNVEPCCTRCNKKLPRK